MHSTASVEATRCRLPGTRDCFCGRGVHYFLLHKSYCDKRLRYSNVQILRVSIHHSHEDFTSFVFLCEAESRFRLLLCGQCNTNGEPHGTRIGVVHIDSG